MVASPRKNIVAGDVSKPTSFVLTSKQPTTDSTPKQAKSHCPAQLSSLMKFAQHVCGTHANFSSFVTESTFEANPTLYVGDSIMESCAKFFSSQHPIDDLKKRYPAMTDGNLQSISCLQFLQEMQQSALRASSDQQLSRFASAVFREKCLELTNNLKLITVRYAVLVLTHFFTPISSTSADLSDTDSILLHCLTEKIINFDFVALLCSVLSAEFGADTFEMVFAPLLNKICCHISVHYSVNDPICTSMFEVISFLAEIQVSLPDQKKPQRLILDFLPSLVNWLPPPLTIAEGREIQRLSFLGPFLSVSCLNEDDPHFATSVVPSGLSDFKDIVLFKKIQQTINSIRYAEFNWPFHL